MSYLLTGEVVGVSKIATGTPAALCASGNGTFTIDPNTTEFDGIGGQAHARGGSLGIMIDLECVGLGMADQQLWWPAAPCVQVAAFPDILATLDDGTNGAQYVLSGGQPRGFKASVANALDAEVRYSIGMSFALATPAAAGADTAVYNELLGHSRGDITVALPDDEGALAWELEAAMELEYHDPMKARGAAAKRFIEGLFIKSYRPSLSVETSEQFTIAELLADVYTGNAITITMANGTVGENVIYTIANAVPSDPLASGMAEGNATGFNQRWVPASGSRYGWCAVSAS